MEIKVLSLRYKWCEQQYPTSYYNNAVDYIKITYINVKHSAW